MPDPITALAIGGTTLIGGYMGGKAQERAAKRAAEAQIGSAQMGIAEQGRRFDALQEILRPYSEMGASAFKQQGVLAGVGTPEEQQAAITGLESSPIFQALARQGETSILQNASATGGLRGGNLQAALAQFRPQMLAQELNQRFNRLGTLSSIGQASAAGVGAGGLQTGGNIANLLAQQGAAQAGSALATGQRQAQMWNMPGQLLGMYVGGGGTFGQTPLTQFGTIPGSQQTQMLNAQQGGM